MNNLVSIINPCYNSKNFINQCVESVLAQTYTNWEIIIVDDFSTDNSREVISSLTEKDIRIKAIYLDNNIGAANARNIALKEAKGKYVAFLDSDDLWHYHKLEKQILFMRSNDIAFSYTSYQLISEDGSRLKKTIKAPFQITYYGYLKNTIIGCLTVVLDREKIGSFEMPNISTSHDMALWLLIMKRGIIAYGLEDSLASYRIVSNSNTSSKIKASIDVWKVYREVEKLSFVYSFWCFSNYIFNAIRKRL